MGEQAPTTTSRQGLLGLPAIAMVLLMAALLSWHSLTDLDIWFHLRAGRDLLAGGGFPHINTYSFTHPQFPWLNHEWLFQVITTWTAPTAALTSDLVTGWHAMRLTLVMALMLVLTLGDGQIGRLRYSANPTAVAFGALAAGVGLLLIWPRFNLRPELLSYLFFVLLVRAGENHYRRPAPAQIWQDGSLWRLFGLIVIWAQCHGFAAIGPVILLLLALLRPLYGDGSEPRRPLDSWPATAVWAPVLLGVVALLLTPNHWRGLLFPLRALGQLSSGPVDLTQTVSELVPLLETANSLYLTIWVFKVSLVWSALFALLGWRRVSPLRVVLVAATAFAALSNQRNIALYGLSFVLMHTGYQGAWPSAWWRQKLRIANWPALPPVVPAAAATLLMVIGVAFWAPKVVSNEFYLSEGVGRRHGPGMTPAIYPQQAALALGAEQSSRTFANLGAAAFLLGTTDARLYIDGRTEAYPQTQWAAYLQLRRGGPPAMSMLNQEKVSAVILALGSGAFDELAANLTKSPAWQVVAADAGGVLFVPRNATHTGSSTAVLKQAADNLLATPEHDPTRRADFCLAASELYELSGNAAGAQRALVVGLEARPTHPTLNHNLGNILMAAGDFPAALPHFQAAVAVNHSLAGSALNAGVCQMRLKQIPAAIESFRQSLSIDSNQVGGWVNLAVALRNSGHHAEAITALEKATALRPDDAKLQGQLQQWRRGNR